MITDDELDYRIRRIERLSMENKKLYEELMNEISAVNNLIKLKLGDSQIVDSKIQDYFNSEKQDNIKNIFKKDEMKLIAVYIAVVFSVFALSILLEKLFVR